MIKASGWQYGLWGDIILSTTLCRTFKELHPGSHLTLSVNQKYAQIIQLFLNHPHVDGFHLWEGSDNFPTHRDLDFIKKEKFDIVYTPKPQHKDNYWHLRPGANQIDELHDMYSFPAPTNKQCFLNQYFDLLPRHSKTITTSCLASSGHPDQLARTLPFDKIMELFDILTNRGYNVVRLDTSKEFTKYSQGIYPHSELSIIDATKVLLSSRLHITADTSWAWISSSYSHSTIGWARSAAYVPVNPRGYYFVNNQINEIPLDQILEKIKEKLKD